MIKYHLVFFLFLCCGITRAQQYDGYSKKELKETMGLMQNRIDSQKIAIDRLYFKIESLGQQNEQLREQLTNSNRELTAVRLDYQEAQKQLISKTDELKKVQQSQRSVQDELMKKTAETEVLYERSRDDKNELERLKREYELVKDELSRQQARNQELNDSLTWYS